ncbi:MAG: hypothetical protein ABJP06_16245 [Sulfitobacter sp.]
MTFAQTYREERLISRRSRARKARIMGRVIGFGLTFGFVVALRTEPELRTAVENLAIAAIAAGDIGSQDAPANAQAQAIDSLGYAPDSKENAALNQLGISGSDTSTAPSGSQLPQSRVKINRGISG